MKVFELFLHLAVPGRLGVQAEIAKSRFHDRTFCWRVYFRVPAPARQPFGQRR
jgi:hypothetical protein